MDSLDSLKHMNGLEKAICATIETYMQANDIPEKERDSLVFNTLPVILDEILSDTEDIPDTRAHLLIFATEYPLKKTFERKYGYPYPG